MNKLQEITQELLAVENVHTEKEIGNLLTVLREIERINSYTMYLEKFLNQNQITLKDFEAYASAIYNKLSPLVEDNLIRIEDEKMKELVLRYFVNAQKVLAYLHEIDTKQINKDEPLQLQLYTIPQPKEVKYPVEQVGLGVEFEKGKVISVLSCYCED